MIPQASNDNEFDADAAEEEMLAARFLDDQKAAESYRGHPDLLVIAIETCFDLRALDAQAFETMTFRRTAHGTAHDAATRKLAALCDRQNATSRRLNAMMLAVDEATMKAFVEATARPAKV